MTFVAFRDRGRARGPQRWPSAASGAGDTITWQLPTWFESMVLVAAIAARRPPDPILHIFREREVGFLRPSDRPSSLVVPTETGGFAFAEMANEIAAAINADGGDLDVLTCDRYPPRGRPGGPGPGADRRRRGAGTSTRRARRPEGRTAHRRHHRRRGQGWRAAAGGHRRRSQRPRLPFPHIGGITWLVTSLMTGCVNICFQAFVPDQVVEILDANGVTLAGSGTVFHQVYLGAWRWAVRRRAGLPRGAHRSRSCTMTWKAVFLGSSGILTGYGPTEAPILTMSGVDDGDEDLAHTEGSPMPGVELRLVTTADHCRGRRGARARSVPRPPS
ncbi:MAG: AMP-binding protein [Acidimicrobiales bacterium]